MDGSKLHPLFDVAIQEMVNPATERQERPAFYSPLRATASESRRSSFGCSIIPTTIIGDDMFSVPPFFLKATLECVAGG